MVGLSPLEKIFYFEFLRVYPGFVSQFHDPMSRLFNIVFIPGIAWIIFLHFALLPFKKYGSGIKGLLAIGLTVFGIINGFYGPWAQFAQTWFFLLLAISVFLFMLETFISRKAMENIVYNASKGFGGSSAMVKHRYSRIVGKITSLKGSIDAIDNEMQSIVNQVTHIQTMLSNEMTALSMAQNNAERMMRRRRVEELTKELENLRKRYDELARKRSKLLEKYQKEVGRKEAFETAHHEYFTE